MLLDVAGVGAGKCRGYPKNRLLISVLQLFFDYCLELKRKDKGIHGKRGQRALEIFDRTKLSACNKVCSG